MTLSQSVRLSSALDSYLGKYQYAAGLRRRDWAWEFLRRNTAFLSEAYLHQNSVVIASSCVPNSKLLTVSTRQNKAREWGLLFFPNPDQAAPKADVFWDPELDPLHVTVMVTPRDEAESDDLFERTIASCSIDHLTDYDGREHLFVRGAHGTAQSRCSGVSILSSEQPVKVSLNMRGPDRIDHAYLAYKRAEKILYPGPWHWTDSTRRLRNALICLDVKDAGLPQRFAASIIFGEARVEREWTKSKSFRDLTRSFYRKGRRLRGGGYRRLLGAKPISIPGPH